jgi:hypothetical protein
MCLVMEGAMSQRLYRGSILYIDLDGELDLHHGPRVIPDLDRHHVGWRTAGRMHRIAGHVGECPGCLGLNRFQIAALQPFVIDEKTSVVAQVEVVPVHQDPRLGGGLGIKKRMPEFCS